MYENVPADLTALRTITNGEKNIEQELLGIFTFESEQRLAFMRMMPCGDKHKEKLWSESAHSLKGGAASIGAENLRLLCEQAQKFTGTDDADRRDILNKIEEEYRVVKDYLAKLGLLA